MVDKYKEDKLVHDKISVKLFFDAYDSGIWALENAEKLNVEVKVVKGAGHFNVETGYDKFELLLSNIKNGHTRNWKSNNKN